MKNKAELLRKMLYIYILISPLVDMMTSLAVRAGMSGMTMGVVVRALFVVAMAFYVLFLYRGAYGVKLRIAVLITAAYGIAYLMNTVSINGLGVLMDNAKMFVKVYFFVFVLLGLYALYREHDILVSDKLLTIVLCIYSTSIFLAAITGTSFPTYELLDIGYCGWFYAGNEIGAIVAILAGIALAYGFTKPKIISIPILGLVAFSSTYIGTKVPFFAVVAAGAMLLVFWIGKLIKEKPAKGKKTIIKFGALLLCILVLYFAGSPIQQNADWIQDQYGNTTQTDWSYLGDFASVVETVDWMLSGRIGAIQNVINRYVDGSWMEKLFGIGYTFQIAEELRTDVVEMDFVSILLKHGVVGFVIYMSPLLYFAVVCIKKLLKQLKYFWELESAILYTYAILIGLGCAFLAGHTLVAPAVSIYIAACIVKLYGNLTEREEQINEIERDRPGL